MTDEPRAGCASEAVREAVRGAVHGALGDGAGAWEVADKAIAAHLAALSAMGLVVVPVSIPRAMQDTFFDDGDFEQTFRGLWDDMIAAAASPMEAPPHAG